MEPDRFRRAEALFHEALALKAGQRDEHIRRAADGDVELAAQICRMIADAERESPTMGLLADEVRASGSSAERRRLLGATIGPYRVIDLIGEGGFGAVYRVEQEQPVRRTLALKILKGGIDSGSIIARFDAERQALAMMEHPNISRVIEAGQTGPELGSRPYFVMEFVSGEPITDYCDRCKLDCRARLELFITVCHAVQHAHQRGVIHRDLKPSNILVTDIDGVAVPKIIDFGIAKAISQPLTDRTLVTQRLELLGTPQYMSPEQADSDAQMIDTRSDIYSLGVVLYELLTGTTPLESHTLESISISRIPQMIRDQAVERPSTRLTRLKEDSRVIAERQSTDAPTLRRRLRGDLDWITLKALDQDRERRYSSAASFADDVRRHLNHEPVEAGPPSAVYRVRKFVRRHRVGVAAAVLVGLAVVGGVVGTTLGMLRARNSADQALQVNQFMRDVFTSVNPDRRGADVRFVEVLQRASSLAADRFAGHPETEAEVRRLLADILFNLDMQKEAVAEYKRVMDLLKSIYGPDDRRALIGQLAYVKSMLNRNMSKESEEFMRDVLPRIERHFDPNDGLSLEAQRMLASIDAARGRYDDAEAKYRDLRQRERRLGVDEPSQLATLERFMALLLAKQSRTSGEQLEATQQELEQVSLEMVERGTREYGPDSIAANEGRNILSKLNWHRGDFRGAAEMARLVLASSVDQLGDCHWLRLAASANLARATNRLGNPDEAAQLALHEIECIRKRGDGDSVELLGTIAQCLPFWNRAGKWAEGESLARELADALRRMGGGHGDILFAADLHVARFISMQSRFDEAETMFQELIKREQEAADDPHIRARLHLFYGWHLALRGKYEAAEERLQAAAAMLDDIRKGTSESYPDDVIAGFMTLYQLWEKPEKLEHYQRLREEVCNLPAPSN